MASRTAPPSIPEGTILKDYRLGRRIGVGSMGEVYAAVNQATGAQVAIKVLRDGVSQALNAARRMLEEARAVRAIRHPGIVDVVDVGVYAERRPFLVMELLEGRTLAERLRASGPPRVNQALFLLEDMLDVLSAAHRAGVVHRDLKPSNIFLVADAQGIERARLLDFGVARREEREEALTAPSMTVGSIGYMAPEQLLGKAVASSDLYSVGCIAFLVLTGQPVFPLKPLAESARCHLKVQAPKVRSLRPELSPALEAWVDRLLRKEAFARPASADQALQVLRAMGTELGDDVQTMPSMSRQRIALALKTVRIRPQDNPAREPDTVGTATEQEVEEGLDSGEKTVVDRGAVQVIKP